MSPRPRIVTFTNLFPSAARPTHGLFVRERMRRVAAALAGEAEWSVVVPVPRVPAAIRWMRRGDRDLAALPPSERQDLGDGVRVEVRHVPYPHLPGLSMRKQAGRIADACRPVLEELFGTGGRGARGLLDAHYVWPDGVAAMDLARVLGVPCFVTARGTDVNVVADDAAVRTRIRQAVAEASPDGLHLFAVAEPLARRFAQVANVPDERVEVLRNGVDLERFRPGPKAEARRALGLPEGVPLMLSVGRLVTSKGHLTTVRALRHLPDPVGLVLVGEGPLRGEIEQSAPPGRVHLLGARGPEEVALAMQACDLLVFPSVREGWPNVVTEALASGRPVVATPVGSIPQMLDSPFVGAMVRGDDAKALAAECARFLGRLPDPARIRAHAERFGWDAPVGRIVERVRAVLAAEGVR